MAMTLHSVAVPAPLRHTIMNAFLAIRHKPFPVTIPTMLHSCPHAQILLMLRTFVSCLDPTTHPHSARVLYVSTPTSCSNLHCLFLAHEVPEGESRGSASRYQMHRKGCGNRASQLKSLSGLFGKYVFCTSVAVDKPQGVSVDLLGHVASFFLIPQANTVYISY